MQSFLPSTGPVRCLGCDHPRPPYHGGYSSLRSSLGAMRSNAEFTGCEVCAILSRGILAFLADNACGLARDDVDQLQLNFNLTASRRSLEVALLGTPVTLSFFTTTPTPWLADTLPDLPVGREVPPTTSSAASLAWAVAQLQACKQSHRTCARFPLAALPTRVLDLSAGDGHGVRLHVSAGETAPYVALSHCWGRRPFLRTLSGSLDAHRSEIAWAALPPTFRDAIDVTRRLGIRYLWIDSLCIVQDDDRDWRREAARMASVYQNAALALSASRSDSAYGGLYAALPEQHRVYTVDARGPRPSSSDDLTRLPETVHLRAALTHPNSLLSPYHAPTATLPTFTRAWILQERFLSPRILHFGPEELLWECLESTACQCSPASQGGGGAAPGQASSGAPAWYTHLLDHRARPKSYYHRLLAATDARSDDTPTAAVNTDRNIVDPGTDTDTDTDMGTNAATRVDGEVTLADRRTAWRRLVQDYSALHLTFERDVFPAVSGLARTAAEAVSVSVSVPASVPVSPGGGDDPGGGGGGGKEGGVTNPKYCAGLWEDALLTGDLLWRVELPSSGPGPGDEDKDGGGDGVAGGRWKGGWFCRPRQGWRAPSWSWASVTAPVAFLHSEGGVQAAAAVVEVRCEPVGEDPMGELREGGSWLVLRGRLIPARLRFKEKPPAVLQPWDVADLDVLEGGYLKNLWVDDDCRWLAEGGGELPGVYCLVVGRKLPRKELLCLLLAEVTREENAVLRDGSLGDGCLYRRIGMLEVIGGPPRPVPWGWQHELLDKGEDAVVRII